MLNVKKINLKYIYLVLILLLCTPSITYLINNKTVSGFNAFFTFFLRKPKVTLEPIFTGILLCILLILIFWTYFAIIRNRKREFKDFKQIILFIIIISIIFGIMLPFTTSDIFYYMGTAELDYKYNENPFYTTVSDLTETIKDDEILNNTGIWGTQTVVYGPLYSFISKLLSAMSFSNVTLCLYIFKLASIALHILTCIFIYKITKRKLFVLLYGLNPFILFEMISNVHNDLYMIFFIVLSLYLLLNRKNILSSLVALACATCIKYVAVLLAPFLVLYYLKKEKIGKKVLYSLLYATWFLIFVLLFYLIYVKDINIFINVLIQQDKYRESISMIILEIFRRLKFDNFDTVRLVFQSVFMFIYVQIIVRLFFVKNIKLQGLIREYNTILTVFLFIVITNLCPWYTSWIFPTLFWLKGKAIKTWIYIQLAYELCVTSNFILHNESYKIGIWFLPSILAMVILFKQTEKLVIKRRTIIGKTYSN